jgi:ubiquinol-cytochrome c reductase iron-sulfur subunit
MATVEHSDGTLAPGPDSSSDEGMRRRDFINIAAVSVAGVGAAVTLFPLVNQMNPSADVLALASIEVDLAAIEPGQAVKTIFRKQPLFIRHLTPAEIQAANAVPAGELRDPQTLADRTAEGKPQWLITMGVCTHLGCVPRSAPRKGRTKAITAAISAPATAPITTPPAGSAGDRPPRISRCRPMCSRPTPS